MKNPAPAENWPEGRTVHRSARPVCTQARSHNTAAATVVSQRSIQNGQFCAASVEERRESYRYLTTYGLGLAAALGLAYGSLSI